MYYLNNYSYNIFNEAYIHTNWIEGEVEDSISDHPIFFNKEKYSTCNPSSVFIYLNASEGYHQSYIIRISIINE